MQVIFARKKQVWNHACMRYWKMRFHLELGVETKQWHESRDMPRLKIFRCLLANCCVLSVVDSFVILNLDLRVYVWMLIAILFHHIVALFRWPSRWTAFSRLTKTRQRQIMVFFRILLRFQRSSSNWLPNTREHLTILLPRALMMKHFQFRLLLIESAVAFQLGVVEVERSDF